MRHTRWFPDVGIAVPTPYESDMKFDLHTRRVVLYVSARRLDGTPIVVKEEQPAWLTVATTQHAQLVVSAALGRLIIRLERQRSNHDPH